MPAQRLYFSNLHMDLVGTGALEEGAFPTSPRSPDSPLTTSTFGGSFAKGVFKAPPQQHWIATALTDLFEYSPSVGYFARRIFVTPPLYAASVPADLAFYIRMRGSYTITNPIAPLPEVCFRVFIYVWKADNTIGDVLMNPIDATTLLGLDTFAIHEIGDYSLAGTIGDGDRVCVEIYDHVTVAPGGGTKFGTTHYWGSAVTALHAYAEFPFEDDGNYFTPKSIITLSPRQIRDADAVVGADVIVPPDAINKLGF